MANPYSILFQKPGTKAFSSAGFFARMPLSMTGIGIITMLSQTHDSYWLAGAVAATFAFSMAILAPQISRAVDRVGQSKILPWVTLVCVLALIALFAATRFNAPQWTLYLFAALAGCMPSMSAMVRARWTQLYRGSSKLHTAFSFESVLDEICFIVGPPISVGLSVALFPEAGIVVAALLLAVGVYVFVSQKATEPPIMNANEPRGHSVLTLNSVKILVLALIALGTIVGTIDVIAVAFAKEQGQPAAASLVLSAYALSSCIAGLVFGTLKIKTPLPTLFLWASLATALTAIPFFFASDIWFLSGVVFVAGIFFSPTMIIAMGLVQKIVPEAKLTEGLTWMVTGLGIGVAVGAAIAGSVIDQFGTTSAFGITLFAGLVVLLVAYFGQRLLRDGIHIG
ncbi:MAG: MFS transporter [Neisseriaceae bacterium]|nr:MFS transporter [Neisseriaceae bacterium]MBP6862494.1 MFS transporter [Neisseriaceae bacterium]